MLVETALHRGSEVLLCPDVILALEHVVGAIEEFLAGHCEKWIGYDRFVGGGVCRPAART